MAEAATAAATPLLLGLPDEIVIWEILVRLDPKSLLRCRAVRRAWRCATSARRFLLAHHARQPTLPLLYSFQITSSYRENIFTFDHRSAEAQLQHVARFDDCFCIEVSCDGLLILAHEEMTCTSVSVCNPATRQYATLGPARDLEVLGMYPHRPTGDYRLLLCRRSGRVDLLPKGQVGCYVFAFSSNQEPRYIAGAETLPTYLDRPVLVHDRLHWNPVQRESKFLLVFDTIAESFWQMRPPIVSRHSYIFELDGTLGFYTCNRYGATEIVDIWVLQNYESEVWDFKHRIKLPGAEIMGQFEGSDDCWDINAVSHDGGVFLLVSFGRWVFHVDRDGKLVSSSYCDLRAPTISECRLKQSLVQHTFFPALEGYAVNASPFV